MTEAVTFIFLAGVVAAALIFAFVNGFHDGSNVLATMISSRSLPSNHALILGASSEFLGAVLLGKKVAETVGFKILNLELITLWVVLTAIVGAILWDLITWWWGVPSSSSHALIGGLLGAAIAESFFLKFSSLKVIHWSNVGSIFIVLFISPPLGMGLGFFFTKLSFFFSKGASPKINRLFKILQTVSSFFIGLSHASNDAPKTMGIIVMALSIVSLQIGEKISFAIPGWVVWTSAFFLSFGILKVGWRIMRTVGKRLYRIRPIHGFGAQSGASFVILLSSLTGFPVSTTQIVNSSVIGAGAAERPKAVKWDIMLNIFLAWIITIPASAAIAGGIYSFIRLLIR